MRTVHDLLDLTGRVALVTGGAGHIGSAIAEALAEWGCNLALLDIDQDTLDVTIERCHEAGATLILPLGFNLSNVGPRGETMYHTAKLVHRELGRLDILVNCAAMTSAPTGFDVPLLEQSLEGWDACMNVNLRAPFLLSQACAPLLAASGHGSIINVGSIYGLVGPDPSLYEGTGMGCAAAYATSKGGLLQLTRYLATVLAPSVRVNSIAPGGVLRGQDAAFVERYSRKVPLGRMGKEEDFKGVVAFLASDASEYVTGVNIPVEGGWTAW